MQSIPFHARTLVLVHLALFANPLSGLPQGPVDINLTPDVEHAAPKELLAGVPTGLRSSVDVGYAIPSPTPGCKTSECIAVYASADVFRWPSASENTACLAQITGNPPTPSKPNVIMQSPSIYVVLPVPTIYDLCGTTRELMADPWINSFNPKDLQTLEAVPNAPAATKAFDFRDLPCPPKRIADQIDKGAAYLPVLVPLVNAFYEIKKTTTYVDQIWLAGARR